ncbi:MAG: DUF4377 domain-containing protein [Caldilineaceae bacterium SB0666_bin_21]|nr:DUF4377 domain-containing protein [Caldilineaceae bacterium SB0666_bin_21]
MPSTAAGAERPCADTFQFRSCSKHPTMTAILDFLPAQRQGLWVATTMVTMLAAACISMEPGSSPVESVVLEVTVGPERVECVGVASMQCLVVDGEYFYNSIEDFEYEEGYVYRIRMERYDAWPDLEEPPQDASAYGYRLVEVVSQTPVE